MDRRGSRHPRVRHEFRGDAPGRRGYVDRLLFENADTRRESAKQALDSGTEGHFSRALSILEAKQWDADFEKFFSEQRSYRDASHQIKFYLERTPGDLNWGILTDGKKWRLYGTKDYETQTYYEVDLPEILESGNLEAFKYFYVFFRPGAFVETAGSSFLDDVWSESETAAQELGEDLQDNVFRALRVLGKGFVESNDLEIDPNDEDGLSADELKEQSLVLLYRLMFVLYAESRGLIDPDDPAASEEYQEYFSLEAKREEILDEVDGLDVKSGAAFEQEFSQYSSSIWGRLSELFELIDEGEEDLDIPPYNGGLFSREDHAFLTENDVKDPYIAEVVYWLSTTENDEGEHVPADYADLDTRHLGSIYEGLLEHEFRIAGPEGVAAVAEDGGQVWKSGDEVSVADAVEVIDEGGLYVVNDEGERKATGAYYTPDYVVTYIVEETVDPLLDEIHEDLRAEGYEPETVEYAAEFFNRVQELSILDPAMGSGHFLTKATGYLSKQVMDEVRALDEQAGFLDEQHIRRQISKEVIYGVDINEMAVELSKLSMWLETLAADQPLAFLDHHVKPGNSLVGSDITEVLSDDGPGDDDGQITLTQAFARVRQDTLEHVMDLMADLLAYDNETLDEIKSMEDLYHEIRDDPLYTRLFELANVHTSEDFGVDVPEDAYEQMAGAIEDEADWAEIREEPWFKSAQATAAEQDFFHWELEFPEVFFDSEGEKMGEAGFDAVVGNPPYIKTQNLRSKHPEFTEYLIGTLRFTTTEGRFDIYAPFVEQGAHLSANSNLSYILPNKFFTRKHGEPLREYLSENDLVREILDFGQNQVFSGVTTYTSILSLEANRSEFDYLRAKHLPSTSEDIREFERVNIDLDALGTDPWVLTGPQEMRVLRRMEKVGYTISDVSEEIAEGITSGDNDVLFVEILSERGETVKIRSPADESEYVLESDLVKQLTDGDEINRFEPPQSDFGVVYPYSLSNDKMNLIPEDELEKEYPQTYQYLSNFRDRLANRGTERTNKEYTTWYSHYRARDMRVFESPKLLTPDICGQSEFSMDDDGGLYFRNSAFGFVPSKNQKPVREFYLAVLNSSLTWFYIYQTSTVLENDFRRFTKSYLSPLPVPEVEPKSDPETKKEYYDDIFEKYNNLEVGEEIDEPTTFLAYLGRSAFSLAGLRHNLNTSLLAHLGKYEYGPGLSTVGFIQPPQEVPEPTLQETSKEKPNLRVGSACVDRESPNTVLIEATARYKPDDEDAHETDQWGYTETEYLPAFRITDLTEREADLIEHFVPVAVDEAGGFANFRETATKTNSLIDRLKAIELPDVDDVADDLENYLETKERAEELDAKIEQTDALIDEIVYELYGLTDEEIEIVEDAVGE
ncbi:Eco57I restriction-modification methylase domain-containing protein [Halorubrum ezzemoulense]|uniref:Eco57I restriction-modification methylase domain-containing protein n=1 Tax=Halorubrum ezzemoulense TaxID=337243 RepID=UPI00232BB12C|nr:N-6 DNA methylase [Halorubrum ezzemoulense]MDB2286831.1 Eco57I restriction-modification methylase domain-containing protein [Halorubrum ezzemoulense]